MLRRTKRQRGQGMTEYIIIVALVAIGAIAVVTIFGDNIRGLFGASANALAGDSSRPDQIGGGNTVDDVGRDLKDFAELEDNN